jgi:hypothetical protein
MPLRSTPLILVAVFSICWAFARQAKTFGIPLDLILTSWFFRYCYALLDTVVAGNDELPVLSVDMLNPVEEQRPLVQAVMVTLGALLSWWVYVAAGPLPGIALGALLLCILPATVALLAISDSWVHALSPLALARVMKGLGPTYLAVLGVTLGGAVLIEILARTLDSVLLIFALSQLVFMAMFCFIGGALFERRIELQLATLSHGERMAERSERYHEAERNAVLDRSYALLRLKRRSEAWANLQPWMHKHCPDSHPFTEYHALLEATCAWDDPVIGDRVACEYIQKLLDSGESGLALDALQFRLQSNPAFCPPDPPYAARVAELAALGGRRALNRQLLANAAPKNEGPADPQGRTGPSP